MLKIRKFKSLRGIVEYVAKCSTRGWELYFLEYKLGLTPGVVNLPHQPIYGDSTGSIRVKSQVQLGELSCPEVFIFDGSDIELSPIMEKAVSVLDGKFEDIFKTNEEDYEKFLNELAIAIYSLYQPTMKEMARVGNSTLEATKKRTRKLEQSLTKIMEEMEDWLNYEPIAKFRLLEDINKYPAIQLAKKHTDLWKGNYKKEYFAQLEQDLSTLFASINTVGGERDYGIMAVYYVIRNHFSSLKYKPTPASVKDYPFHDEEGYTELLDPSEEIFCQFLTYQILRLFSGKAEDKFSRLEYLKYKEGFTEDVFLDDLDSKYREEVYANFENHRFNETGYIINKARIESLGPQLKKYIDFIYTNQPMDYDKINLLHKQARNDEVLVNALRKK